VSDDLQKRRVERLWADGLGHLAREAYNEALDVARQLERERFSGAFDLAARALIALGRLDEAIETLERGVKLAPAAWLNWQLLGNCLSEVEKYDQAAAAYASALGCANVWADSIRLNQAILAERCGDLREALQIVDQVHDPELALQKADVTARLLLAVGDAGAAIEHMASVLCSDKPTPVERGCLARLHRTHAQALLRTGEAPVVVQELLRGWIVTYPESAELLLLLREMRNEVSEHARVFGVSISYGARGAEDDVDAVGFVRAGRVIADTPEEALSFLRAIEGTSPLALDGQPEAALLEDTAGAHKGVISLSPRHYYAAHD
jgi:hypothetical protein